VKLIHAPIISLTAHQRFTDTTNAYRAYPKTGKTPTKISFFKGNSELMKILLRNARGAYNPKEDGGN
jgi:hypothetical protein